MEIKRKYIIKCLDNGNEIEETDNLTKAKRIIQQYLIDDYNEYLEDQKEKNGKFITYWKWFYTKSDNGIINGKMYEYEIK